MNRQMYQLGNIVEMVATKLEREKELDTADRNMRNE
jgi:hypothetical protein